MMEAIIQTDRVIEKEKVQHEIAEFKAKVDSLTVVDQQSFNYANEMLKEAKSRIKVITDRLEPAKKKAFQAYQEWNNLIKELTDPLKAIESLIKGQVGSYLIAAEKNRQHATENARKE